MNQNDQQPSKADPKGKAVASLVLGVISIIISIGAFLIGASTTGMPGPQFAIIFICLTLVSPLVILICLAGITLGIMGLKSAKKNFAIIGIILCLFILILCLFILLPSVFFGL